MTKLPFAVVAALVIVVAASKLGCTAAGEGELHLGNVHLPVVYGTDDREDYYEALDPRLAELLRDATVALVTPEFIDISNSSNVVPYAPTLQEFRQLCEGQRFAHQPAMAECSGTLIDWDLVLTAGHCADADVCQNWYFVMGYYMLAPGELNTMTSADVYTCDEVLVRRDRSNGFVKDDYAIVRLDRPVEGDREPATVSMEKSSVQVGDAIASLGFGDGIPGKVHGGAMVLQTQEPFGYFFGTTDTFYGNSGSGTYNADHEIVGIFVRSRDEDYVREDDCYVVDTVSANRATHEYDYAYRAIAELCDTGYQSERLCSTPEDCSTQGDEDGDGAADCTDSDCAGHPACDGTAEDCAVVGDEDGDGAADCTDSDCAGHPACDGTAEDCAVVGDEDGDGAADCTDSDCAGHPACDGTAEDCAVVGDEDGDGAADCTDSDCAGHPACDGTAEDCAVVGDEDGDGAADCKDSDCAGHPACDATAEDCNTVGDEDGDGAADCDDSDCSGYTTCLTDSEDCNIVGDEDSDGAVDCADSDCLGHPSCRTEVQNCGHAGCGPQALNLTGGCRSIRAHNAIVFMALAGLLLVTRRRKRTKRAVLP